MLSKPRLVSPKRTPIVLAILLGAIAFILIYYPKEPGCPIEGTAKQQLTRDLNKLKNRSTFPLPEDFDTTATIEKMLAPGDDRERWNSDKAVTITGFVANVKRGGKETCNCDAGDQAHVDTHIELTVSPDNDSNNAKLILEVTPAIREIMKEKGVNWSTNALQQSILNKHIKVQGWLMYDTQHGGESANTGDGDNVKRGTAWEIHPVTAIEIVSDK